MAYEYRLKHFRDILSGLPKGSLVDLGAGHCKFSQIAHDEGWDVTAVDARDGRVPKDIPFQFIKSDVRSFGVYPFDVVAILGLFYHLTLFDQKNLLSNCAGRTLIIDTHFAPLPKLNYFGYEGENYHEGNQMTSSWGNPISFWHTKRSLIKILSDYNFEARTVEGTEINDRAFFIATAKEHT